MSHALTGHNDRSSLLENGSYANGRMRIISRGETNDRGIMFVLEDDGIVKGECVVTEEGVLRDK